MSENKAKKETEAALKKFANKDVSKQEALLLKQRAEETIGREGLKVQEKIERKSNRS